MNSREEIKYLLNSLLKKRRFRHVSAKKLYSFFENAEFDESYVSAPDDELDRIKRKARNSAESKSHKSRVTWILKPAFGFVLVSLFAFAFFISKNFYTPEIKSHAILLSYIGPVSILRNDNIIKPEPGMRLQQNDSVKTGKDAFLELVFNENLRMRIADDSIVRLSELMISDQSRKFTADLDKGVILLETRKLLKGDLVSVKTATSVAAIRGTLIGVIKRRDLVSYEVYEGKLSVRRALPPGLMMDNKKTAEADSYYEAHSVILKQNNTCSFTERNELGEISYNKLMKSSLHVKKIVSPAEMKTGKYYRDFKRKEQDSSGIEKKVQKKVPPVRMSEDQMADIKYIKYINNPGIIVTIDRCGNLTGLDSRGGVIWSLNTKANPFTEPFVNGKYIYLFSRPGTVSVIDTNDGKVVWRKYFDSPLNPYVSRGRGSSEIFVSTKDGSLYRINGFRVSWRIDVGSGLTSRPVCAEYIVFVSTNDGKVYGIDRNRGIKVLKVGFDSEIISMSVEKQRLYLLLSRAEILCYNYQNDERLWSYSFEGSQPSGFTFTKKSLFVYSAAGFVYRLSTAGELIWKRNLGNEITIPPSYQGNKLFIVTDRTYSVVGNKFGDIKWSVVVPPVISHNFAESDKNIYFVLCRQVT